MEDHGHVAAAAAHNEHWRQWLTDGICALGLNVTPSVANFVLIHFPDRPGCTAADADGFLTQRGLILRRVTNYGLPDALRMTVGTEEANRLVLAALGDFVGERGV
jgi:histidinol-phosphate aminotransferase